MDKYEYKLKTEQMLELMENGAYNRAAEIADTIDWRRVRNSTMLTTVSDIYEKNGNYQKCYEILHLALHRTEGSRKVLYRLCTLSLRTGDVAEAIDYYDEFLRVAPKDPTQYILRYKILRARRAPIEQQIEALCEFKKAEYIEEWAYELAKRYQEAGMTAECLEECDDLILWFSEGKYVYKAMELKMQYKPLTPSQREKYDHRYEKPGAVTDRIPNVEKYQQERQEVVSKVKEEPKGAHSKVRRDFSEITLKRPEPNKELEAPKELEEPKEKRKEEAHKEEAPKRSEERVEPKESVEALLQRLENKGIAKTMKLEDALKSLLNPGAEEAKDLKTEVSTEETEMNFEDELPELETAIEEIESVIDVNLVSAITERRDKQLTHYDSDLEELKAEPVATTVSHRSEEALDKTGELLHEELEETSNLPEKEAIENTADLSEYEELESSDETMEMPSEVQDLLDETVEMPNDIGETLDETVEMPVEELVEESEEEFEEEPEEEFEEELEEPEEEFEEELEEEPEELENESLDEMEEIEMEKIKKDTSPILPEEIQRLIDEIEGVQPEVVEEKETPIVEKVDEEPHENMGEITQQLRIDDIEAFLNEEDDFTDLFEEELEEEDDIPSILTDDGQEEELADTYEEELEEEEELVDAYEEELEEEEELVDAYEEKLGEEEELADAYEEELEEEEELADAFEEDYDEIQAGFEEEFRVNPKNQNEVDDREIPDEEEFSLLSKSTPLSRKETAKLIATGKTSPLPMNEISDALSLSGTGFLVHGRYDLETQSEVGTRAGLTEEQKKLFSYFVPVRGMSEQLVDVLEQERNCTNRRGTSKTGNLLIIGSKGNGKTVLAVDVVKAIQKQRNIRKGKVAIVTGESLNKKRIGEICDKLYGGALIIEKASKMNEKTVARLNKAMERDTGELLVVLEEQRKPLERLLASNREFRRKFTSRLEVPIFINDELVTFGQTYAQENGYRIDEMGILALYSRIDALQREDHSVTIAEVKEVMDEAIGHSKKTSAKKLVKKVFGKNTDDKDRVILSEKDFNI